MLVFVCVSCFAAFIRFEGLLGESAASAQFPVIQTFCPSKFFWLGITKKNIYVFFIPKILNFRGKRAYTFGRREYNIITMKCGWATVWLQYPLT